MTGWVVSTHGSYNSYAAIAGGTAIGRDHAKGEPSHVKLPEGFKMHFFVEEKKALFGGWDIFQNLMNPATIDNARAMVTQTLSGGDMCRNYTLTPAPEWNDAAGSASGVFKAGDRHSTESWIITDPSATWHLSQLLKYVAPTDELFWVSCRVQIG